MVMPTEREQIERRKDGFLPSALLAARDKTRQAVQRISRAIQVGMLEEEAYELSRKILSEMGSDKNWHRPWIRFGSNTLKPYGVLSMPRVRLKEEDIFFIDIGPVWDGYEGDGGNTFVTGSDVEMLRCQKGVCNIFSAVKEFWQNDRLSGKRLYEYAVGKTKELGWELNLRANGHRLSDFPHALYFKGGLSEISFDPAPHAWVLEIQIRHPKRDFGAFYEDLLF